MFPELEEETPRSSTGSCLSQDIERLINVGAIRSSEPIPAAQIQPSSLDLRIGPLAYQVEGKLLPEGFKPVLNLVRELSPVCLDLSQGAVLEKGKVYIIPAIEELSLPADIMAKANPKSTIGRLDILTRLITDYGSGFERVPRGYKGNVYVEVAPRTFNIRVRQGDRLNQLRFLRGNPLFFDAQLSMLHQNEVLVFLEGLAGNPLIDEGCGFRSIWMVMTHSDIIGYQGAISIRDH